MEIFFIKILKMRKKLIKRIFCHIFSGASDSASDNDLNVYDEDLELNYNEIKSSTQKILQNQDNENIMKKLYSSKKLKDTEAEEDAVR
jgi:viroplasmin and RNaseH domain-containing protein